MTNLDKLKQIRSKIRHGDQKVLASEAGINRGQLSNYLKNCETMVLNGAIVNRIIRAYHSMFGNSD